MLNLKKIHSKLYAKKRFKQTTKLRHFTIFALKRKKSIPRIAILTLLIYTNTYVKNSYISIHLLPIQSNLKNSTLHKNENTHARKFSVILTQNNLKNFILRRTETIQSRRENSPYVLRVKL